MEFLLTQRKACLFTIILMVLLFIIAISIDKVLANEPDIHSTQKEEISWNLNTDMNPQRKNHTQYPHTSITEPSSMRKTTPLGVGGGR
jgi:hypothetical protein